MDRGTPMEVTRTAGTDGRAAQRISRRSFAFGAVAGLDALLAAAGGGGAVEVASWTLDDRSRIAHLLRRTGFGPTLAEIDEYAALGLQGAIDRLLDYDQVPDDLDARIAALRPDFDLTKTADLQQWWLLRMTLTRRPLQEKLTLFWHGFLTSALSKVNRQPLMLRQNQFLRDHALSDYRTIMQGMSQDPAMLLYLDAGRSRKSSPNENFARELMELFTIGLGQYTEQDVFQAARAFTGWSVDKDGDPVFTSRQYDSGDKTILGRTGRFTGKDVVNIVVEHPMTGWRLARKLFTFFAYDPPDGTVLQPMVEAYYHQGYSVKAMLRAMFTSEAFVSPSAYRARIKSPTEFVVGAARQLGLQTNGKALSSLIEAMGQRLFDPPNVAGWPGGASWLNSGTWLNRLNYVNRLVTNRKSADTAALDLAVLLETRRLDTPDSVVEWLVLLLLDGHLSHSTKAILIEYAREGRTPKVKGPLWTDQRWVDERARGLVYLIMAMPEYHLN